MLENQDAVISTLGDTAGAVAAQENLIKASIVTGVKRFIPSEYGSDTMNSRVRSFPFFSDKLKHQELLAHAAAENEAFSYCIIITGPFLDWGLSVVPFIINVGSKSAQGTARHINRYRMTSEIMLTKELVFDGGDVPFSTTRVATLAKAMIATLRQLGATENKTLYIHDAVVTQNQLIARSEMLNGQQSFARDSVDTKTVEKTAWAAYNDPTADPLSWILSFINISLWSGETLCSFQKTDNKLLGITELEGAGLDKVIDAEILRAMKVFANAPAASGSGEGSENAAEKAFEDGKRNLVGCARGS